MSKKSLDKLKKFWNKFWFIVWKDDSPKGWIISFLFIFIMIKFVFFPTLSLITGTQLPLAIVSSCSMYHEGNLLSNFDNWWSTQEDKYSEFGISKSQFEEFHFKKGFNKGDVLFVLGANPEEINRGDVIIFGVPGQPEPIIHRIVQIELAENGKVYSTIGDNNPQQISFEKSISEDQLIGRASVRAIPYIGWIKIFFSELLQELINPRGHEFNFRGC